jgi:hypothetical protein
MIKKLLILSVVLIMTSLESKSQIRLPKNFKCILGKGHPNESFFTDGTFTFKSYPWGHEGLSGQEVVDVIEEGSNYQIKFRKTKDNLFWATGEVNGEYVYIIIAEQMLEFKLSSVTNDSQFSNYSKWMLQQIRKNIASKQDNYFTDFNEKGCFDME